MSCDLTRFFTLHRQAQSGTPEHRWEIKTDTKTDTSDAAVKLAKIAIAAEQLDSCQFADMSRLDKIGPESLQFPLHHVS
jgi:hypothetical protein